MADSQALLSCLHGAGVHCTYAGVAIFLVSAGSARRVFLGRERGRLWACKDDEPGAVFADGGESAGGRVALGVVYA